MGLANRLRVLDAAGGQAELAREHPSASALSDALMPKLDGLGSCLALRSPTRPTDVTPANYNEEDEAGGAIR